MPRGFRARASGSAAWFHRTPETIDNVSGGFFGRVRFVEGLVLGTAIVTDNFVVIYGRNQLGVVIRRLIARLVILVLVKHCDVVPCTTFNVSCM